MGVCGLPSPERDVLIAVARVSMGSSCPNITILKLRTRFFMTSLSEVDTALGGMRVISEVDHDVSIEDEDDSADELFDEVEFLIEEL